MSKGKWVPLKNASLVQIKAPHFTAGLIAVDHVVENAAPILSYMVGWDSKRVAAYVKEKGWEFEVLSEKGS